MKYSFTINQKAIVDSGLKLDLHDACIMAFIHSFALYPKIEKKFIGNKVYCWFQYAHIVTNLPLLSLGKDAVYRRLKNMVDLGLLETHPDNQICGKAFFHLTERFFTMFFETNIPTVDAPNPYVHRTDPPTVLKPDNNSINNNKESLSNDKDNVLPLGGNLTTEYIKEFNKIRNPQTPFKLTDKIKRQFKARVKDGFKLTDFLSALQNAMKDQFHIDSNFNHLTAEFFTRTDKLEKYLNYKPLNQPDQSQKQNLNF